MADSMPAKISGRAVISFSGLSSSIASLFCCCGFFTKLCKHCYWYKEIPWKQRNICDWVLQNCIWPVATEYSQSKNYFHSENLPVYQTGKGREWVSLIFVKWFVNVKPHLWFPLLKCREERNNFICCFVWVPASHSERHNWSKAQSQEKYWIVLPCPF